MIDMEGFEDYEFFENSDPIPKEKIREALEKGIMHIELDEDNVKDEKGNLFYGDLICTFGDYYFYFAGENEANETPEEYITNVGINTVVDEIYDALEGFRIDETGNIGYSFDEWNYYNALINELL